MPTWKEHFVSLIDVRALKQHRKASTLGARIRKQLEVSAQLVEAVRLQRARVQALQEECDSRLARVQKLRFALSDRPEATAELAELDRAREALAENDQEADQLASELQEREASILADRAEMSRLLRIAQPLATALLPVYVVSVVTSTFLLGRLTYAFGVPALAHFRTTGPTGLALGTATLLMGGTALYVLRSHWRRIYAATELSVAGIAGYWAIKSFQASGEVSALLQMAAAVYLVVRGLDNFAQGHRAALEALRSLQAEEPPAQAEEGEATAA